MSCAVRPVASDMQIITLRLSFEQYVIMHIAFGPAFHKISVSAKPNLANTSASTTWHRVQNVDGLY